MRSGAGDPDTLILRCARSEPRRARVSSVHASKGGAPIVKHRRGSPRPSTGSSLDRLILRQAQDEAKPAASPAASEAPTRLWLVPLAAADFPSRGRRGATHRSSSLDCGHARREKAAAWHHLPCHGYRDHPQHVRVQASPGMTAKRRGEGLACPPRAA